MGRVIGDELVEPVVAFLLGAIDVDGGATDEQLSVLAAIVSGYWGRTDLDVRKIAPTDRADFADPAVRRRVRELMVLLEFCRHPLTASQTARVDLYAATLGDAGPGVTIARDLVAVGVDAALADYARFLGDGASFIEEPTLRGMEGDDPAANAALAARLHALHDLPPGTLGYEYVEFYLRNGIELPGDDANSPAVFVAHDMSHVIGGYEPTGQGEIALGAMQLALDDTDVHWMAFLGNLGVHEAGYFGTATIVPKTESLLRPGAIDMLAEAFRRGAACTGDFTTADHLALANVPLADVRAQFGVPPLE